MFLVCGQNPLDALPKEQQDKYMKMTLEMMDKLPPEDQERLMEMGRKMGKMVNANKGGGEGGAEGSAARKSKPSGGGSQKRLTLKKARSMMQELVAALTSADARERLEAAGDSGRAQLAEELADPVLKKYSQKQGLQAAMQAAMASGGPGTDRIIRTVGEDIEEAISGKQQQSRIGRVPALDVLAEGFLKMDKAAREAALATAESTASGELYVEAMREIMEEGDSYVVDAIVGLVRNGDQSDPQVSARMNVLQEFLGETDLEAIGARLQGGGEL